MGACPDRITWGLSVHRDDHWNLTFVKRAYEGTTTEFADPGSAFIHDHAAAQWVRQRIDFRRSVRRRVMGILVPVMSR